ncbi:unnamed protein product [Toxocara canis]|uniref:Uncharacterized protein n=1 Tax=Toxocara canis TaxID=6265 RepID=A0A183VF01_TOXCA|nr:unnamed protein product [Toxocara canis]
MWSDGHALSGVVDVDWSAPESSTQRAPRVHYALVGRASGCAPRSALRNAMRSAALVLTAIVAAVTAEIYFKEEFLGKWLRKFSDSESATGQLLLVEVLRLSAEQ